MRRLLLAAALAFSTLLAPNARAAVIPVGGNFNGNGYATVALNLPGPSLVDFLFTGGIQDATFSLFDGAGNFIIYNDDAAGVVVTNPHITRNLAAGNYTLLVSYCCQDQAYLVAQGAADSNTDGFNLGFYRVGGTATLAGLSTYLDGFPAHSSIANMPFTLTITTDFVATPEPATIALLSASLLGLGLARRRRQA